MIIRLAAFFALLLIAATGPLGAVSSPTPNEGAGPGQTARAGGQQFAAASAQFLACKEKCNKDNNCEARYGVPVAGIANSEYKACAQKRGACIRACPK